MKLIRPLINATIILTLLSCSQEKEYTIGVSQCSEDIWRDEVNKELRMEAMLKQDINLIIKSVKDDSNRQIADIESFIKEGVDLIVVSPNESSALTPVISKAFQSGIPVILFDRKIQTNDYTAFIGANNYRLAYQLGTYLAERIHQNGNVVILRGLLGSTADTERYNGFMDAIKQCPGINIVAERHANYFRNQANIQMGRIIDNIGIDNIDAVFAMNDQMAAGADDAIQPYNPGKKPFIVGIDGLSVPGGGLDYIGQGKIDASFIYPTGGDKIIDVAYNILNGLPYERENILNSGVIDRSNYTTYKLQSEQIAQRQRSLDQLSSLLNNNLFLFRQQKTITWILVCFVFLFLILFAILLKVNKSNRWLNMKLQAQNEEIRGQVTTLNEQKDKLNTMSEQLKLATNAKLMFFTDISHEFKTPITLIMGTVAELFKSTNLVPEEREMLTIAQRNSAKLMSLLNQILEFRAYEHEQLTLKCKMDYFDKFLANINTMFKPLAAQKHITLSFSAQPGESESDNNYFFSFDAEKVEKIYFNILSNAFKFTNDGGIIRVILRHDEQTKGKLVKLSIFNSGSYIPKEKQNDIFRRFYHIDGKTNNSGIGLALAKALTLTHKGTIEVESEQFVGTTFTITLPTDLEVSKSAIGASDEREFKYTSTEIALLLPQANSPEHFLEKEDSSKPKILVIEDNEDMRRYLHGILCQDYNVLLASDGQEGIDKAVKNIPAVVISDVMMPKADGYEVAAKLKNNIITQDVPIILLTAYDSDEQRLSGYKAGADSYIVKPFNADPLKARIRNLIEKHDKSTEKQKDPLFNPNKTYGDQQVEFISRIRQFFEDNIQAPVSIDDLCSHLGVSKPKLYRQLKEITDYSPVDIMNLTKLRKAVSLMLNERKTISEAAYETGFNSPSYFTKLFVRYYGEKPSDYIKQYTK